MIKLRKSKSIRHICFLLSITLFYISCSQSISNLPDTCSNLQLEINENDLLNIPNQFEIALELVNTIEYQESFTTFKEYFDELFLPSDEIDPFITSYEQEYSTYMNLGFEDYINTKHQFSDNVKDYLIDYSQELLSFLETEQPNLQMFTEFLNNKQIELSNLNYCSDDLIFLKNYLALSQGFAQFYFKNYFGNDTNAVSYRCGLFKKVGCILLSVVVGAASGLLVATLGINIVHPGAHGNNAPLEAQIFADLIGVAIAIWIGRGFFSECCDKEEIPTQECNPPTGAVVRQVSCDEFTIRLFGSSIYGATEWMNDNTNPDNIITNWPFLRFSVPTSGNQSNIVANITCLKDASTIVLLDFEQDFIFETNDNVFPLEWVNAPPPTGAYIENFTLPVKISVNTPSTEQINYEWSINPPHEIIWDIHNANAKIIFRTEGAATTQVTTTNICTGESESLSATTIIQ